MYKLGEIVIIPIDIKTIPARRSSVIDLKRYTSRFRVLVGDSVYEYPGKTTFLEEVP